MIGDAAQYEKELAERAAAREIIPADDDPETAGTPSGSVALLLLCIFSAAFISSIFVFHYWGMH
jgi:hypothetical protein